MSIFFFKKKSALGIDIGSFSIKMVELEFSRTGPQLKNFGVIETPTAIESSFGSVQKNGFFLPVEKVCESLKTLFSEAEIKINFASFSLPDFATFFTQFEIPKVPKEEIPAVIKAEAKRHIPLSLSEVVLDWKVFEEVKFQAPRLKVLLVAVPNEIVEKYRYITKTLGFQSSSLEIEVFSLARVFGKEGENVAIFDLGAKTTSCTLLENKDLKFSFSIEIGGEMLTEKIANTFGTDWESAEEIKKEFGIKEGQKKLREILLPLIDEIFREGEKVISEFERKEGKEIKKIVLVGGGANLPGLIEYAKLLLKREVEIGFPFTNILFPPNLEGQLREIGPMLSIGVGLALKGEKR